MIHREGMQEQLQSTTTYGTLWSVVAVVVISQAIVSFSKRNFILSLCLHWVVRLYINVSFPAFCCFLFEGIQNEDESEPEPADRAAVPDFSIEYAKTDRDACKGCTQQLRTGALRIMKFVPDANVSLNDTLQTGQAHWYHLLCFIRQRHELGWLCSGDLLPGFKRLSSDDKASIEQQIP